MRRLILAIVLVVGFWSSGDAETLQSLRFRVANSLDQDTAASASKRWSHAEIDMWINDAIRYISHVALCYVRETTFALVVSRTDYSMPADYIRTQGVVIGSAGASYDLDNLKIGLKATASADLGKAPVIRKTPTQWEELGEILRQIRLSPAPGVMIDTVRATFYAYSRQLSGDTVNCLLPLAFQYCIPDYAASQCWAKTRLPDPYWPRFIDRLSVLVPTIQKGSDPEVPAATPGGVP